jgi:DNA-binding IclR family transcriptional regulator
MSPSSNVPAARQTLAILSYVASRPGPVGAAAIARDLHLPRSTTYHLLTELAEADFITHYPEDRTYGLGVASFEIGSAYLRHEPLERLARPVLRRLVDESGHTAHLGILQGAETLYLLKEQPAHPLTLITDIGVRLPAHLTASGRAMLAHLSAAQTRALFPSAGSFQRRTDRGPSSLRELRLLLRQQQSTGWAYEDGEVTHGYASVAACVFDHGSRPMAAISVTFADDVTPAKRNRLGAAVMAAAEAVTSRISGRRPA